MRAIVNVVSALPLLAAVAAAEPQPASAQAAAQSNKTDSGDRVVSPPPPPAVHPAPGDVQKVRVPTDRAPGRDTRRPQDAPPERPARVTRPMVFYIATAPDGCGPGCHRWIAAEGAFDAGAAERLRKLLARPDVAKLPIFFHSPGGLIAPSLAIGRMLRTKGMTAGVSVTRPEQCAKLEENACTVIKQKGEVLAAELHSTGTCLSACVFSVIGAKVRQIPPGARLGVHESRITRTRNGDVVSVTSPSETHIPGGITRYRSYVRDMGIDDQLLDLAAKTPHRSIYILSRDEIARLRIDARTFQETPWLVIRENPPYVAKLMSEAKGPNNSQHLISMVRLECTRDASRAVRGMAAAPANSISVIYVRGLGTDGPEAKRRYKFAVGDRNFLFSRAPRVRTINSLAAGGQFEVRVEIQPAEIFEKLDNVDRIEIAAVDEPAGAPAPVNLSTSGLARAFDVLRLRCADQQAAR